MSNQTRTLTGIVLREIRTKESDKIITVLTQELGVISIYAKGAMRLKNKFHSATGIFTYSEFIVYESSQSKIFQLNEASVKKVFHKISARVEYIALAMYMSELVCEVSVPDEMSKDILRLFLNCMYMLSENKWSVLLTKAAFEMRLLSDIGYRPNVRSCIRCKKYENEMFFFDIEIGAIRCPECVHAYNEKQIVCEPATLVALRYIVWSDFELMFTINLVGVSLVMLSRLSEAYTLQCTKEKYKTLEFLKPLLEPLTEKEFQGEK